jgi:cyanophycin synthetase
VYRLLFLDGVLLDVVRRRPPRVVGDGSSTLIQLITAENRRRVERRGFGGLTLIRPDLDCILALRRVGLRLSDVPAAGARIEVKTSNADGGDLDTETVHDPPSPALVAEAAAACATLGARLAGVDLATPDLGRDIRNAGGAVIEVNVPPGLQFHYLVADRARATHVAVPILRALLDYD